MRTIMHLGSLWMLLLAPCLARGADPTPARTPSPPPPKPEHVSTAEPRTPEEEQKALHLPEGFVIELVAAEPDIHKPLNLAFDDQGRLWVTDTL